MRPSPSVTTVSPASGRIALSAISTVPSRHCLFAPASRTGAPVTLTDALGAESEDTGVGVLLPHRSQPARRARARTRNLMRAPYQVTLRCVTLDARVASRLPRRHEQRRAQSGDPLLQDDRRSLSRIREGREPERQRRARTRPTAEPRRAPEERRRSHPL